MLNLLNREKRHFLRREYFGRLANVSLGVVIFSLSYYSVLLFSNSILINFEKTAAENELKNLTKSSVQKELDDYQTKLAHIQAEYNLFSKKIIYPTTVLAQIKEKEIPGISLSSINFQKTTEEGVIKLEISGVAKDRDTLINYSSNLKTNDIFKDFNIPVSSLAKNKDIPFSFPVNVKINKKDEK